MASDAAREEGRERGLVLTVGEVAELVAALRERRVAQRDDVAHSRAAQRSASAAARRRPFPAAALATFERVSAAAAAAAERAHAPYSSLHVGAAVVDERGAVFVGCNVENASFGLTLCAERNALGSARVCGSGEIALVVVTSSNGSIPPCGACRQVILELAPSALVAACDTSGAALRVWSSADLLPDAFGADGLPAG
jgi:cytidine deaminase